MSSCFKLNFDGASVGNAFWGWGFVLRNHNDDVVLVGGKHGTSPADANTKEARSCLYAKFGARNVTIEGVYLPLIFLLRSRQIHDTSIDFLFEIFCHLS